MTDSTPATAAEIVRAAIRAGSSFYGELTLADAQRGVDALRAAGWMPPAPPMPMPGDFRPELSDD